MVHTRMRFSIPFLFLFSASSAFLSLSPHSLRTTNSIPTKLYGLYDTPLPPPPERRNDESNNEENDTSVEVQRLFQFNLDGTEQRDLLPRLSRSLDSGIGCYFEESAKAVIII